MGDIWDRYHEEEYDRWAEEQESAKESDDDQDSDDSD